MKILLAMICVALMATAAGAGAAEAPVNWIGVSGGVYSPQSSDVDGYDAGFAGSVFVGHRLSPRFAAEIAAGRFSLEGPSGEYIGQISGDVWNGTFDITAVPLTATLLRVFPRGETSELFAGAGVGAYLTTIDALFTSDGHPDQSVGDSATALGVHGRVGGHWFLGDKWGLGVEAQYVSVTPQYAKVIGGTEYSRDFGLDGFTAQGRLFLRF